MRLDYLKQAWLVLALALAFGGALAAVQSAWGPKIEANKRDFAQLKIPGIVLGTTGEAEAREALKSLKIDARQIELAQPGGGRTVYTVYRVARAGELLGWVVKAAGQGYAGKIELLVGLDPPGATLTGLAVLVQTETPGLGNKIEMPAFRGQFRDRPAGLELTASPSPDAANEVAVCTTGATISSQAVCDIVNRTVDDVKPKLDELRK